MLSLVRLSDVNVSGGVNVSGDGARISVLSIIALLDRLDIFIF